MICLLVVSLAGRAAGAGMAIFAASAPSVPPPTITARQIGACEPEVAQRVDRRRVDGDFLLRLEKQREHVDLHGIIAQHQSRRR